MMTITLTEDNYAALLRMVAQRWAELATQRNECWYRRYVGTRRREVARKHDREFAKLTGILKGMGRDAPLIEPARFIESLPNVSTGKPVEHYRSPLALDYRAQLVAALTA